MSNPMRTKFGSHFWVVANPFASATTRSNSIISYISIQPDKCQKTFSTRSLGLYAGSLRSSQNHITKRNFTSTPYLPFPNNAPTETVKESITSCTNIGKSSLCTILFNSKACDQGRISYSSQKIWYRSVHTSTRRKTRGISRRNKSSSSAGRNGSKAATVNSKAPEATLSPPSAEVRHTEKTADGAGAHSYFNLPHMPKLPHRPTKDEILAAATGFWSRLRVRFKWFSIRSARPFNVDDWSAFVSWLVLGHIVWILVGTTTFFSLLIFAINTVVAQETLARWVGDYLTQSAGIKVVFENAIVPKWGSGVISFQKVFVSRRPGQGKNRVSKGSSLSAAAAAAAERQADSLEGREEEQEDTNYTQFDVTIDAVNVTLSFAKWWNGKGLLRDVEVKGVRGVVDRTSVHWGSEYVDPRTYKHEHNPGDFEIECFKMEDLLLTIHQPKGFRPFQVSVFTCELPQLRKQWLFYDFLSANQMSGAFDGSLFNIHPHQSLNLTAGNSDVKSGGLGEANVWKKHSRLRMDALKIDHLNRGVDGPFGWIHEGNVDIVADIMFPPDNDESIAAIVSDLYDRLEATVTSNRYLNILENHPSTRGLNTPEERAAFAEKKKKEHDKRFLVMDLKVHLNDVRAAVPLFTHDLSYINQALVRPIVAYINSKKTFIPINCRIVKRASEFDGSWTIFDSGLMEDLSAETYEAFAKDIVDNQARLRRLKKVGMWSIGLAIQALFMGMAGNVA